MVAMLQVGLMALCTLWGLAIAYVAWAMYRLPRFEQLAAADDQVSPLLSIVVPACNEAANIESAVQSILRQDYPNFELILVDDRSTDGTGDIIDRLARNDGRIRALHVTTLPDNWLGKVHALDCGVAMAQGDWLLFTDADVHHAPDTARRAVGWAAGNNIDHLALAPLAIQHSFLLDIVVHAFMLLFLLGTRAATINQPSSRAFVGVGAFNLVRRTTFLRTPGFAWLRLEPCDDVGLGLMIKLAGGRSYFAFAERHLSVAWYPSVMAMFNGLEKNLFGSTANYQAWVTVLATLGIFALAVAPTLAVIFGVSGARAMLIVAGIATWLLHGTLCLICPAGSWRSRWSLVLAPIGLIMIGAMMINAAWQCLSHGGIDWRGTHYPLPLLRAGQRVKLLST